MTFRETPHFFRIILNDTLQAEKLLIPIKFVTKYGQDLSNTVYLRLPCGTRWEMKSAVYKGNLWLETGWPEFAKRYSLKRGDLLVFRYLGRSMFRVVICDSTFTEIDYPCSIRSKRKARHGEFSTCAEKTEETPPRKMAKIGSTTVSKGVKSNGDSRPLIKKGEGSAAKKGVSKLQPLRGKAKLAELEKASGYQPTRPSFRVLMQPSCPHGESVVVEAEFARKYMKDQSNYVNVEISNDKRTWRMNYRKRKTRPTFEVTRLCSGWRQFVRDNDLKALDVCVFVLLKGSKDSLKAKIFRADNELSSSKPPLSRDSITTSEMPMKKQKPKATWKRHQVSGAEKDTILERARFESRRPNFKVLIQQSYTAIRGGCLGVPSEFWKGFIKKDCDIILRREGKSWPAELCIRKQSGAKVVSVRGGWRTFADDNHLKVRDVCYFELVDEVKMLFDVRIRRYQAKE